MVNHLDIFVVSPLLVIPCGTILLHCYWNPSFFAIHPAANSIAFHLCFPFALYVMAERRSSSDSDMRQTLVKTHFASQLLGFFLMLVAGACAYMAKDSNGKAHFTSTHSWLAIATEVLFTLQLLAGILKTFFGKYGWQWKDSSHRIGGTLTFFLSAFTIIFGTYSGGWGVSNLGSDAQLWVAASTAAGYSLLFLKSFISSNGIPAPAIKTD